MDYVTDTNEKEANLMFEIMDFMRTHYRRINKNQIKQFEGEGQSAIKKLIMMEYLREVKKGKESFYAITSKGLNLFEDKRKGNEVVPEDLRKRIVERLLKIIPELEMKSWEIMFQILYLIGKEWPITTEEILSYFQERFPGTPGTSRASIYRSLQLLRMKGYIEYHKISFKAQSPYRLSEKGKEILLLSPSESKRRILKVEYAQKPYDEDENKALDAAINYLTTSEIDEIFKSIEKQEEEIGLFLNPGKTIGKNDNFFLVLRRWNSFTPALPRENEKIKSLGGGYFLAWKGHGIVIDPGFNFIDNFKNEGFKFDDIDAVFVTHDHQDHTNDVERILTLLYEFNDKNKKRKSIRFFMNRSSLLKYIHLFIAKNDLKNLKGSYSGENFKLTSDITIEIKKAFHQELMGSEFPIGLLFKIKKKEDSFILALPGDTRWDVDLIDSFKKPIVHLLVTHIGTITRDELASSEYYQKHLGYRGTFRLIREIEPEVAIISEFGEELLHHRINIGKALETGLNGKCTCLAGDIGLKVEIPSLKIWCEKKDFYQGHYCSPDSIEQRYRDDGQIVYRCKEHSQYS